MYWLAPPPILRYLAAGAVVLAAVVWDLWPEPTTQHPFAAASIAAGSPLEGLVEWRSVPDDLLPVVEPTGIAIVDIGAGEPVLPSHVGVAPVPDGWWVVALDVPPGARVGGDVRVAVTSPAASEATLVRGVVVSGAQGGPGSMGSVAVPEGDAGLVAAAAAGGRATVLVGSG